MSTIEIQSTSTTDDIEVRQDEFAENRRILYEERDRVNNPKLSQAERDEAKNNLLRVALKNIHAANTDIRVVDKVIDKTQF